MQKIPTLFKSPAFGPARHLIQISILIAASAAPPNAAKPKPLMIFGPKTSWRMGTRYRVARDTGWRRSAVRPDREFIARWLGKLKTPPAGKFENRLDDGCTMMLDKRLAFLKIPAVENDQRTAIR